MSNQIVISSGAKLRGLNGVITGTTGVLDSVPLGAANGVATLDSSGKVPVSQLPSSVVTYLGTWNAATNTPTLVNGTGDAGDMYICNVAGTVNFGAGPITFAVGDWVLYGSGTWQKSNGQNGTVTSVAVTESGDALNITGSPITTSGTINIGFAGTSAQYVAGDGTLITFPSVVSEAQNLITEVYNETGATLAKGTVIYINGGHGNLPTVTKAIATSDATSAQTYGVVRTDITNNNNGYVTVIGRLENLDTQAYAAGTQLYLSSTTAGAWTSTKQYAPAHLVYVGIVVRSHPTQGVVEVKIQNGYELDELHDVSAQTPSNNDGLFYNSSNSLWENKSIATALGYTPANDSLVVHLAGTETITGAKTFSNLVTISTASYLTSRLKLTNTATGGNIWSVSSGNANNSTNNGLFSIINETLGKNIFSLSPTGNIIIGEDVGTANPAYNLQVIGTNTVIKATDITGNNSNVTLQITNSAAYLTAGYATTAIPLIFQTGNTTRLTIAATGEATLTGALNGTSATFSGSVVSNKVGSATNAAFVASAAATIGYAWSRTDQATDAKNVDMIFDGSSILLRSVNDAVTSATNLLSITRSTGAATFSSSVTATGDIATVAGAGILSGGGGYAIGPSSTRGIIAINGSGDQLLTFSSQSYIYNSSSLFRMLSSSDIDFVSNGSQRMIIKTTGNVGIGTSSPSYILDVRGGTSGSSNRLNLYHNYSNAYLQLYTGADGETGIISNSFVTFYSGSSPTERMRITSGGNVLIGTTSSDPIGARSSGFAYDNSFGIRLRSTATQMNLQIAASSGTNIQFWTDNGANVASGSISSSGSSTSFNTTSDYRLKEDFIEVKGLEKILAITTYNYKWKNSEDRMDGVIAHELAEVLPYAVHGEKDGKEMQGVDYSKIVPILIKGMQEQQKQIEELKAKIK